MTPILAETIDNSPSEGLLFKCYVPSVNHSNLDRSRTFVLFYYYDNYRAGRW
ncbi:unnamed protein product [marine sediment metagenome]|uniref:Uncharacterized protein n=1 Tax=marine sediment metagenome TaxID=412755 RepID=X1RYH5_9ZZZZ